MSSDTRTNPAPATALPEPSTRHPLLALIVLTGAELMVVLDATIVNIALPTIQRALDVSVNNLSWIVSAYALAFGGVMLLGGRVGDLFGRRRIFRFGIVLFVLASLLGGVAPNLGLLILARVLQGVGAAIAAPTSLALIATTFAEGKARNRAMGLYAAMAGVGSTLGLLLGGTLTEYLNWRWVFLINVPIGIAVLAGTLVLREPQRSKGRLDYLGAALGTGGLLTLAYGITRGGRDGWSDGITITCFGVAAWLLALFLFTQLRNRNPMLPLHLLRDRSRAGSYGTIFLVGAGMFGTFYFLTLYTQQVLHYSAVKTGLAFLPINVGIGITATVAGRLMSKVPPRLVAAPGLVVAAIGAIWLSTLTPHSSYLGTLMPAMFVLSLGLGATFVPLTLGAVRGVDDGDSGIASAVLNTGQQIGGAFGVATLAALAASLTNDRLGLADGRGRAHGQPTGGSALSEPVLEAMTYGYTRAFIITSLIFASAMVIAALAINAGPASDAERHGH
ncbi:MFS transporter [Micromonospora sp. SL1-18]|uniref:MFS transporter n=1 Tax=Micromonospora sp. SL1-18 TaxID=3399128 RepID=UPI003A4DF543